MRNTGGKVFRILYVSYNDTNEKTDLNRFRVTIRRNEKDVSAASGKKEAKMKYTPFSLSLGTNEAFFIVNPPGYKERSPSAVHKPAPGAWYF